MGGLLLLVILLSRPAFAQEPSGGEKPVTPGQTPAGQTPAGPAQPATPPPAQGPLLMSPPLPDTQPVPVIPDTQLIPNLTIPSAPLRVLPAPALRAAPTARFQFDPTVTISEEYTDNFNLTERNRKSNFRTTVAPGLALSINGAFLKGLVSYKFAPSYDTVTDDFSLFHSLLGQVVWDVTPRWKLTMADTFIRSDEPGEADRLGLRQQRRAFTSNTLLLASDYLLGQVATRASYQFSSFSDDDVGGETKSHTLSLSATAPLYQNNSISGGYEYLLSNTTNSTLTSTTILGTSTDTDVTGHKFTAGATRRLNTLLSAGVTGFYAMRTITGGTITSTSRNGEDDFRLWNASVFGDYELPGRLKLSITLGVSQVSADSGISVGPNLSTKSSLTYQFARAVLTLAADKGFSETFGEGENFGVVETEGVTGSLLYPFTPSLTGTLSGYWRHNKPTGIGNSSLGIQNQAGQETETWGGTLNFSWRLRPGLLLELSYTYTKQQGSDTRGVTGTTGTIDNSYTENRVKAAINLSF